MSILSRFAAHAGRAAHLDAHKSMLAMLAAAAPRFQHAAATARAAATPEARFQLVYAATGLPADMLDALARRYARETYVWYLFAAVFAGAGAHHLSASAAIWPAFIAFGWAGVMFLAGLLRARWSCEIAYRSMPGVRAFLCRPAAWFPALI